ncbi:fucose 4-O-acetylase [Paenibacillus oenotherae]|uniref:Fucose 4-O-acetylase n=1 Tax=Paenibacillus oenotherae TaxID=1435645 RepID=A0ABS7DB86_9BACL|nr:acyltransferase family protein [Paenibacillus oenotherae]MBW7477146.1 fucose 4-O-acetylase [Paenibacillus oenotherae]
MHILDDRRGALHTYITNVKFILIALVVSANMLEPVISRSDTAFTLYKAIYLFHIPAFVLVMGYMARESQPADGSRFSFRAIAVIGYQYVLFQSLYTLADAFFFHASGIVHSFFMPYSLLWFLCSHLCWKLLLPLFMKLRHPLTASVLLGIAVGYIPWDGSWLSISRTFVFFPFFIAGYRMRRWGNWQSAANHWRAAAIGCGAVIITALGLGLSLNQGWLYGSETLSQLGHHAWYSGIYRLGIYALEAAALTCFLLCVPWRSSILTAWGKRTLFVFLLHGFIIKAAIAAGLFDSLDGKLWHVPLLLSAALALTLCLSHPLVERYAKGWIEPAFNPMKQLVSKVSVHPNGRK